MKYCMAHRGFSGIAPENTIAAFRLAIEHESVDSIELDVQRSKDGELIIIHDFKLGRTANGEGFIKDKTFDELRKLDAGSWFSPKFAGEKIPTFEEVLNLCKGKCKLNVELKTENGMYDGYENQVIELIKKYEMEDDVCLTSFDKNIITAIKKIDTKMERGLIVQKGTKNLLDDLKESGSTILSIKHKLLTPELVDEMKREGIKMFAWTVNKKEDMERVINLSSDIQICTNFPSRFSDLNFD